jgi:protein-arginine kinase activator protein McsA
MAFATKQKLTCPNCKATKIVVFGDVIGAKELTAHICQKCKVSMKSEAYGIGSSLNYTPAVKSPLFML